MLPLMLILLYRYWNLCDGGFQWSYTPRIPNVCSLAPPKKAQLRAPLSPLQTAWTGFDPNLYSDGSSSAGPALVEIATARSFILNRGIVTDTMSATPWSQDGEQCIPLHRGCCFLGGVREQTFGSNAPPTGTLFSFFFSLHVFIIQGESHCILV